MKKQTTWLVAAAAFCMGFSLFASPFITVAVDVVDFLKGLGVGCLAGCLITDRKHLREL